MLDQMIVTLSTRAQLATATSTYEQSIDQAADFLSARGITREIAVGYRLGVVCDPIPGHERFEGMLALPYLSPAGVLAMKFRALDPEQTPKYNAPEGQSPRLYNVAALHTDGDVVAICEGEIDALVMTELVGIPAVGVPGASNWQPWYPRTFADYETVLVIADNDVKADDKNPGMKHARRVVKEVPGARLVTPPPGLDLNDWYLRDGVEAVRDACGA